MMHLQPWYQDIHDVGQVFFCNGYDLIIGWLVCGSFGLLVARLIGLTITQNVQNIFPHSLDGGWVLGPEQIPLTVFHVVAGSWWKKIECILVACIYKLVKFHQSIFVFQSVFKPLHGKKKTQQNFLKQKVESL